MKKAKMGQKVVECGGKAQTRKLKYSYFICFVFTLLRGEKMSLKLKFTFFLLSHSPAQIAIKKINKQRERRETKDKR